MHKLARLTASPMVDELMRRLREESIEALCAEEKSMVEIYGGSTPSVGVWIAAPSDLERASAILQEVQAAAQHACCPGCGYDLRGHAGRTNCPECGRPLSAPLPDVTCPACGEAVPGNFEVCWSCGGELPAT